TPAFSDIAHDWLCASCLNPIASDKDRHMHEGRTEFAFVNPEGTLCHIVTFAHTTGCHPSGTPTLEHTWFPGFAWCHSICDRCRVQLGWFYTGPANFAGLLRERLVFAA